MKPQINMIGIITSQFDVMRDFYRDVLGFGIILEVEQYVEFANDGVRFCISTSQIMHQVTHHHSYQHEQK